MEPGGFHVGVLDDKFLPEWAKPKLAELHAQEQTDAPHDGRHEYEVRRMSECA